MFKFQFYFIETGEMAESDYKYKFPHTAKQGALAFLRDTLKHRDRKPDEETRLKIMEEGVRTPTINSGKSSVESLISWLTD